MRLTRRQREVAERLAVGQPPKAVAADLGLSLKTVEYHWAQVKRVLGIGNVVELAHWALRRRWVKNLYRGIGLIGLIGQIGVAGEAPPLPAAPAPTSGKVSVTLAWDASPSPEVTRYRVYWGPCRRSYTNYVETPCLTATVPGLVLPQYFAATAVSSNGLESEFSQEVGGEPVVVVTALARTNLTSGEWTQWTQWTPAVVRRAELPGSLYLKLTITNEWR